MKARKKDVDDRSLEASVLRHLCVLGLWYFSPSLLGSRSLPEGAQVAGQMLSDGDGLFHLTSSVHNSRLQKQTLADALRITRSIGIDLLAIFLIVSAIVGSTQRPFLALRMLFSLRQICSMLSPLPAPSGMIWHDAGFPPLRVTDPVANDLFFSGHSANAILGAAELARCSTRGVIPALLEALFEMSAVIGLLVHYTINVYAGCLRRRGDRRSHLHHRCQDRPKGRWLAFHRSAARPLNPLSSPSLNAEYYFSKETILASGVPNTDNGPPQKPAETSGTEASPP